jgi:glycosyltransferase involved in cell wall biosynthesis
MKVSVLVPVFNTEPSELERCISSLLCQRFEQYEIIIVDDGSVPCPQRDRLIASYSTNPIINCVRHEKNLGLPSARNTALRIAVGEFVVHVDSDDYWITDSVLKKLYETAIIDGCDVLRFNGQYSSGGKLGARLVPKIECVNKALNAESKLQVFRTIFLF